MNGLGKVIRGLRENKGLRLKDVAEQSGFSESYISQVERGVVLPSVTALEKLAGALNVNVSHVFELAEQANNSRPTIIRRSEREPIQMGPDSQFKSFLLAPDFQRQMEPVLSRAKPGAISHTTSHEGEEFMILLSGRMRFCFGDEVIELGAGDAAYFDCRVPHRWENIGEDEIEALWVITPPSW